MLFCTARGSHARDKIDHPRAAQITGKRQALCAPAKYHPNQPNQLIPGANPCAADCLGKRADCAQAFGDALAECFGGRLQTAFGGKIWRKKLKSCSI